MAPNEQLPAPSRSAGAGESRRDQIVAAAAALFAAQGYHATSMQEIGQRVGLLKGSLYAHVVSKEELLLEIVSTAVRQYMSAMMLVVHGEEPPDHKIARAVAEHLRVTRELGPLARVYVLEARHLAGEPARWAQDTRERYDGLWRVILDQGVHWGCFRRDLDVPLAAWLSTAALAALQLESPASGDDQALAARLGELLLAACR